MSIEAELKTANHRIKSHEHELSINQRALNRTMGSLNASAFCERLAFEALVNAVTVGAATWIGRGITAAITARTARAAAAARVAGVVTATNLQVGTGTAARIGAFSRVLAGGLMFGSRRLTGDFSRDPKAYEDESWKSVFTGLVLVVMCGSFGKPGVAKELKEANLFRRILNLGLPQAGRAAADASRVLPSRGAVVNLVTAFYRSYSDANLVLKSTECARLIGSMKSKKIDIVDQLDKVVAETSLSIRKLASEKDSEITKEVNKWAAKKDFKKEMSFVARNFDFNGNQEALKAQMSAVKMAKARIELWNRVKELLLTLEKASTELRKKLKTIRPQLPVANKKLRERATKQAVLRRHPGDTTSTYAAPPDRADAQAQRMYEYLTKKNSRFGKFDEIGFEREWGQWVKNRRCAASRPTRGNRVRISRTR